MAMTIQPYTPMCIRSTADKYGYPVYVNCNGKENNPDIKYVKGKPFLIATVDGKNFLIPMTEEKSK